MSKKTSQVVFWSSFTYEDWKFYLAATNDGLLYVGSPNQPFEELKGWAEKRFLHCDLVENHEVLRPFIEQLIEYFKGKRCEFTFSIDTHGTSFQEEVWNALKQIPYGETCNYSQIAEMIQRPRAVRAVGSAIGANPVLISVPCHRVIGKNGKLTGFRAGLEMKKHLLELEKKHGSIN